MGSFIMAGLMTSCNDFLDTMPDKRTELTDPDKIRSLLLSAYPTLHPTLMFEYMSDDYSDNGEPYQVSTNLVIESYFWQDAVESDWDSPLEVWEANYKAISTANHVLEAIDNLGNPQECAVSRAEALLCRAYGHFQLANTFCMAYNERTADKELGIPYAEKPEKVVGEVHQRGTLAEVYEKINRDIEEALPLIRSAHFDVPLYHFNENAAYAFAARFNLFYGKDYDKVIRYATEAIGEDPTAVLRDLNGYDKFTTKTEWTYGYISENEPANLLLITNRSKYGRAFNLRYAINNNNINSFLVWSLFPGDAKLAVYNTVFSSDYVAYFVPKMTEIFEITNPIAQTGQPHVIIPAFTTDEALLCRAEAHVLKKDYDAAATDLSYWYQKKGAKAADKSTIMEFYGRSNQSVHQTPFNTGVTYDDDQLKMLYAVLHARRVEGIHEGVRWLDVKRYNIPIEHNVYGYGSIQLPSDDPRRAIQIPQQVLSAPGEITPNPR